MTPLSLSVFQAGRWGRQLYQPLSHLLLSRASKSAYCMSKGRALPSSVSFRRFSSFFVNTRLLPLDLCAPAPSQVGFGGSFHSNVETPPQEQDVCVSGNSQGEANDPVVQCARFVKTAKQLLLLEQWDDVMALFMEVTPAVLDNLRPGPVASILNNLFFRKQWQTLLTIGTNLPSHVMNRTSYNLLIRAYAKTKQFNKSLEVFETLPSKGFEHSVIAYNLLMEASTDSGHPELVLQLLKDMESKALKPTLVSYTIALNVLGKAGKMSAVVALVKEVKEKKIPLDVTFFESVIYAFAKAGNMDEARRVLQEMDALHLCPSARVFNMLIHACARRKTPEEAVAMLHQLRQMGYTLT